MADVVRVCCCMLYIGLLGFNVDFALATRQAEQHPAADFSRHTHIKPRIYHGREKRQISSTREKGGGHVHHLTIDYEVDGHKYTLDLKLNRDLIPKGYFHRYQENGTHVVKTPTNDVELCQYQGKVRGVKNSWVALSTCGNELSGVIYDGKDMHYVENDPSDFSSENRHYLYRHSDIAENNKTCGYSGDAQKTDHHFDHDHHEYNRILRYKRATEPMVRGPYNSNKQSRYVELVLVVDNRLYKELGESTTKVDKHCKDITNIINGLYAPLNIFIALVGVVIWTEYDEVDFSTNGDTTLTNFLHYRRETLIKNHPNDNAQLITKFNFDNGVVGKALKGPMCTYEYSGGVNNNHSPVIGLVATTIAHEMGHNFGMEHDTTNECTCPDDKCIMAPSSSAAPPTHWSSCSLEYLALAFEHGMDYCLQNKPEALFDSPVCGNGFVEPGEQCDCGLPEHCDNTCCNPITCTLNANASCATGECCDLTTCRPKRAGTVCRSADIECDLPEYCTGQSEYCPADIYKMDTELCDGGQAYCYHGYCRTRSDQCKLLWGNTGKSSDEQCYKMNTKGTRHGNCGYNKLSQSFHKCQDENILCGMLHCKHLNERLEFGMESVAILSHSFINLRGSIIPCRTAIVDLGLNQVDPGLAPDGAKCGDEKMCVNQKCLSVDSLRKQWPHCPHDCNGNGVCNSLGKCHCKDGFAPPYCDYPGPGGSEHSGPATDPNARKEFVTAMFIIFLGVIPLFAVIGFLTYYARHNLKLKWNKSPAMTKLPSKSRGPVTFQPETLRRPTEDNHSLLADEHTSPLPSEFFGEFKGFTISPQRKAQEPSRPAPPVPSAPLIKNPILNRSVTNTDARAANVNNSKLVSRTQSCKPQTISTMNSSAPALPPLNPGAHPRPIISSPILENSTCTAKELLSPLKNVPKIPMRSAPELPPLIKENRRPLSTPSAVANTVVASEEPKRVNVSALNRIASFLKSNDKKTLSGTNSLPRSIAKTNKGVMDKNALRTVEISNPILQNKIDLTVPAVPVTVAENKAVVMRAQSMRGSNVTPRPAIPTFGSMRQTSGMKRPISIPSCSRPKSPPPPRPPTQDQPQNQDGGKKPILKIPGLPGYQKPSTATKKQNQYDDCLNEVPLAKVKDLKLPSNDNIYAVIEETPPNSQVTSPDSKTLSGTSNSGSSESFGLLGEIVTEIQNRNFDSIYSTSTLARKKKLAEEARKEKEAADTYVNTASVYKVPESVYSNMNNGKSNASTASSDYINPSAVNPPVIKTVPQKKNDDDKIKPVLSTFKNEVVPKRNTTEKVNTSAESKEDVKNVNKTQPALKGNKIVEAPNLRTRKPSPTRSNSAVTPKVSSKPMKSFNSPDLVTSCSTTKKITAPKQPDVLSSSTKKPTIVAAKPAVTNTPKTLPKVHKSTSLKNPSVEKKTNDIKPPLTTPKITKANSDVANSKVMPIGARISAKQHSNVATLQQKFEAKPPPTLKTAGAKK